MSDGIVVRLAEPADLATVGAITAAAYADDGFVSADNPYSQRLADAWDRAADAEVWLAEADGEIVGTVTFCLPGSKYREVGSEGEGEFRMLAVATAARGRGVGGRLLEVCFDRSRDLGFAQLVLLTTVRMNAAIRLYEAHGFVRDESLDWSPDPSVELIGYRAPVPPV